METIKEFVFFIGIYVFIAWLLSMTQLSQFNQGAFTAAIALTINRVFFPD